MDEIEKNSEKENIFETIIINNKEIYNIIEYSNEECEDFGKKIFEGKIDTEKAIISFNYFEEKFFLLKSNINKENITKLIKNLCLISENVSFEMLDIQTYIGKALLSTADLIEYNGSLNIKIIYALCLSQYNKS
eukprot:jgi/Orpsp1_1/1192814/evm.model.d7180000096077.1